MPNPGDPCPDETCVKQHGDAAFLTTYTTKVEGKTRIRYLWCRICHTTGGCQFVPLQYAPRRKSRIRKLNIRRG